jgi:hypothetical protein
MKFLDLAGNNLTIFLAELLLGSGFSLRQQDLVTMENIKHPYCYMALSFHKKQV